MKERKQKLWGIWATIGLLLSLNKLVYSANDVFILKSDDPTAYDEVIIGIQESLGNIPLQIFSLKDNAALEPAAIQAIQSQKPSIVVGIGGRAAELVNHHFPSVPLVYCMVFDSTPFASSPQAVGITLNVSAQDQFSTLKNILPQVRRLGVIFDPTRSMPLITEGRKAAAALNLILVEKPIKSSFEIANAIKDLIWTVDALWMIPDRTAISKESFRYLLEASLNRKVPIMAFSEGFVKGGALLALSPDYTGIGHQTANLVKKILDGSNPASLSSPSPKTTLVLNLNTAKALNITIPPSILLEAGKIF